MHNSDNLSTPVGRLRCFLRERGLSQAEFSRATGLDPSNVSRILSGRMPLGNAAAARIAETFGLNRTWLLSGEGPVRAVAEPQGAPVYDIDITAGPVGLTRDFTSEHIVGHLALPDISPDCPVVRVSGNSMTPTINNGALLSIRPVTATGPIFWGQIYVVVLDDYRMVKYVRRHPDPSMVILHSANHDCEDMEIRRSDIRALFLVEAVINYERRC